MMNVLLSFIKLNIHLSISLFFIILIFSILIKEDFIVFFSGIFLYRFWAGNLTITTSSEISNFISLFLNVTDGYIRGKFFPLIGAPLLLLTFKIKYNCLLRNETVPRKNEIMMVFIGYDILRCQPNNQLTVSVKFIPHLGFMSS